VVRVTARIEVQLPTAVKSGAWPEIEVSRALRADYDGTVHRGEQGAEACTYRDHEDEPHPATVRLTPDPDEDLVFTGNPHTEERTVCTCCAFREGHLYEEMLGQARTNGHVGLELRQDDGKWKDMGLLKKVVEAIDRYADKKVADVVDKAVPPAPEKQDPKGGK
jgi:hypothetical protein